MKKFLITIIVMFCGLINTNAETIFDIIKPSIEMVTLTEKKIIESPTPKVHVEDTHVSIVLNIDNKKTYFDAIEKYDTDNLIYLIGRSKDNRIKTIAISKDGEFIRVITNDYRIYNLINKNTWNLMEEINNLPYGSI